LETLRLIAVVAKLTRSFVAAVIKEPFQLLEIEFVSGGLSGTPGKSVNQ
jgi:hypothetical protein